MSAPGRPAYPVSRRITMNLRIGWMPLGVIAGAGLLAACTAEAPTLPVGEAAGALGGDVVAGKQLFEEPLPGTNGRSCATCHVADQHFALTVPDVAARFAADPGDPLFHPLDADDP